MDELLNSATALVNWLRDPGLTGKSRASRVPAKLLENLESAIENASNTGLQADGLPVYPHSKGCNCSECSAVWDIRNSPAAKA